jgi:hypothetical protein
MENSMKRTFILLLICLLMHSGCLLSAELPTKVLSNEEVDSVKQQLDAQEIYVDTSYAKGRLSNRENYLIVTFLTKADVEHNEKEFSADKAYAYKCALFNIERKQFNLIAKSPSIEAGGDRTSFNCLIEKQRVVIKIDNWSGDSHQSDAWQFKKIGSSFSLVGFNSITVYGGISESGEGSYGEGIHSVNFLTRKSIVSRKSGEKIQQWEEGSSSHLPFRVIRPFKYKEAPFGFKQYPKMTFKNFSQDRFYKWQQDEKNMCGWINEEFKFESCNELEEANK